MPMESLAVIGSLLVALGSLALSGVKEYFDYKERIRQRTGAYREALYQKQTDAILDLFRSFQATANESSALFAALYEKESKTISHFAGTLEERHRETFELVGKLAPLLPNAVMNAATHYLRLFILLIEVSESKQHIPLEELRKAIHSAEFALILESRKELGVDALSGETRELFETRSPFDYVEVFEHYTAGYGTEFGKTRV